MNLKERFEYDGEKDILFINFSNLTIDSVEQIGEIKKIIDGLLKNLDHKVYSIVNYDNCKIDKSVKQEYTRMIKNNQEKYSLGTVRYSKETYTRTFLRLAAIKEHMTSNIYSSKEEAIKRVEELQSI